MDSSRHWYQGPIAVYDRFYRLGHGLDREEAAVPPVLRVEARRCRRRVRLPDGTGLRSGDRLGVLHLDNSAVATIHANGLSPLIIGFEFRRQFVASLETLAGLAQPGQRLAAIRAFLAITIFHEGLRRLGFDVDPGGLVLPWLTSAYQRRLLALLHPRSAPRLHVLAGSRAERLWISRERLVALYGGHRPRPRAQGSGKQESGRPWGSLGSPS